MQLIFRKSTQMWLQWRANGQQLRAGLSGAPVSVSLRCSPFRAPFLSPNASATSVLKCTSTLSWFTTRSCMAALARILLLLTSRCTCASRACGQSASGLQADSTANTPDAMVPMAARCALARGMTMNKIAG